MDGWMGGGTPGPVDSSVPSKGPAWLRVGRGNTVGLGLAVSLTSTPPSGPYILPLTVSLSPLPPPGQGHYPLPWTTKAPLPLGSLWPPSPASDPLSKNRRR